MSNDVKGMLLSYSPGMKWFGSFTNLSIRRPSEKANTKAATEHDGILDKIKSVGGQSVDDMESCPLNSNYACSTEMYTHVGTVPRNQKKKKSCKGLNEKKKKEEEEEGGSQSKTGEHVRDSPLLCALSSLSLTSLDHHLPVSPLARPLPATPVARRASPLTSASENSSNDPTADPIKRQEALSQSQDALVTDEPKKEPSNMATNGPKTALSQDVYVRMDPITEAAHSHVDNQTERQQVVTSKQETTKTANSSEAESIDRWEQWLLHFHKMHWRSLKSELWGNLINLFPLQINLFELFSRVFQNKIKDLLWVKIIPGSKLPDWPAAYKVI